MPAPAMGVPWEAGDRGEDLSIPRVDPSVDYVGRIRDRAKTRRARATNTSKYPRYDALVLMPEQSFHLDFWVNI